MSLLRAMAISHLNLQHFGIVLLISSWMEEGWLLNSHMETQVGCLRNRNQVMALHTHTSSYQYPEIATVSAHLPERRLSIL